MMLDKYIDKLPAELDVVGKEFGAKLLKLYAFYAYYDGDDVNVQSLNDSCFYSRTKKINIDGVFINKTLEEDALECVYVMPIMNGNFSLSEAKEAISDIKTLIYDALIAKSYQIDQQKMIYDNINDFEIKKLIIRIITDYVPSDDERYEIKKSIESINGNYKSVEYNSTISFGDDIEATIQANISPFDFVDNGFLRVDSSDNVLKFNETSFICNISAKSLKDLWVKEGKKGLLAMNLRYHVKGANVDEKIEDSIINDSKDFWYLNNGIIIVCSDFNFVNNELRLKEFSIVNGGQTSKMIGETPINTDFFISCKVIKNIYSDSKQKNYFISKVAEASNTQKPIKPKDLIANKVEQRELKDLMIKENIFVEVKRGEKAGQGVFSEAWQKTKNNELAQDLYSFVYLQPGPARNSVSQILINKDKYQTIFVKHQYNPKFLKSLLFIEKSFKYYQTMVSKNDGYDPTSKGLVKNGLHYALATIGYYLKHYYCPEFTIEVGKTLNHEQKNELFSKEPAFDFYFIKSNETFKEFKTKSIPLFDFIINKIKAVYEQVKEANPNTSYANWTKQNTGFKAVRKGIDFSIYNQKNLDDINYVGSFFEEIDDNQRNINIDFYYGNFKKAIEDKKEKDESNTVSSKKIWDELLIYRLNKSNDKHVKETKILTDKELNLLSSQKPQDVEELSKLVRREVVVYSGDEILEIIRKNSD